GVQPWALPISVQCISVATSIGLGHYHHVVPMNMPLVGQVDGHPLRPAGMQRVDKDHDAQGDWRCGRRIQRHINRLFFQKKIVWTHRVSASQRHSKYKTAGTYSWLPA